MEAFRSFLHTARSTEARYARFPWGALLIIALPLLVYEALESSGHWRTATESFGPGHWLLTPLLYADLTWVAPRVICLYFFCCIIESLVGTGRLLVLYLVCCYAPSWAVQLVGFAVGEPFRASGISSAFGALIAFAVLCSPRVEWNLVFLKPGILRWIDNLLMWIEFETSVLWLAGTALLLELLRGFASDRPVSGAELCLTVLGLVVGGAWAAWLDHSATRGTEPGKSRARSARRLHVR